ncbi:MAG: HAD family phosphatase [Candidatus Bathyarchaeota archaeon]|nr:MAG: HAD family phosphatase [Candidatus Bathyarchaeota archaeon]
MKRVKPVQRRCAFFDVDGTLLEGFIIQSFPRFLADKGFIEAAYPNKIDKIISDYHSGEAAYREVAEAVPSFYASALKGRQMNDVKTWARKFMKAYLPKQIFPYSKQLIHHVRNLVDVTIAISGSPLEAVKEIRELGFDSVIGSLFEEKNGIYTGRVIANLILGEEKAEFARKICEELDVDFSRTVAFGDTDQDEALLSMVSLPIAINPNKRLKDICTSRGWRSLEKEDLNDLNKGIKWLKHKIKSL